MKFRALAVSCCSVALLTFLSGCASQEELNAEKERADALEEKVNSLAERLTALEAAPGPKSNANAGKDEAAAKQIFQSARRNVAAQKYDQAKMDIANLLTAYPKTRSARSAQQLSREVAIIGQDAGTLDIEKWYSGEAKMDDGKVTVLVFWEAWCPHCKREVPKLEATYQKYKDRGLNLIGLTKVSKTSTDEKVQAFIAEHNLSYPTAKEAAGGLSRRFAVSGVPASAMIKDGKIVWRGHPNRLNDKLLEEWLNK
ncbi:MAG: redoxin domain-containing protein [Deltaproteobacteria bacterium]|nr:redoxin domain-containing protein [Deltaproteobacteria bacterium]